MNLAELDILIVDDQEANVTLLEKVLTREGYARIRSTTDPAAALGMLERRTPDLLLLDLHMPHIDGFAFLETMAERHPRGATYVPVLVLTADASLAARQRALSLGARDFVTKPFDQHEVLLRVRNLLETRALHLELRKHNVLLESRVRERTQELSETVEDLQAAHEELRASRTETIERLAVAAEFRDDETASHIQRMSSYCGLLAKEAGADDRDAEELRVASIMHDVGKIGIPDGILLKPGPLTADERTTMQTHTEIGFRILSGPRSSLLARAAEIALTHHERPDGAGYPRGLSGAEVSHDARVVAIADVFDALTTDRVYRKAFPLREALDIMEQGRGTQFDPELLDLFLSRMNLVLAIKKQHEDASTALPPGAMQGRHSRYLGSIPRPN